MDIVIGTSGHIDHGKTALVKALTGIDADRLPEEKERGITIDLGFAELDLGQLKVGFVDVPGHEKFIKNMLAGASGINLVLLVVAADEGVMPQTREHFEICRLLGVEYGIVVLTKCDLVEDEFLDLVKMDVAELVEGSFLESAPVIAVSSLTGEGIEELRSTISIEASKIPARLGEFVTRLPIDRTFTVKGFGAVVTGTLSSGEIAVGSEQELLPPGKIVRVRGVQTHGREVSRAIAGQRTAVNIGGIAHEEIERGMVLTEPDSLRATQIFDAEVEVLESARHPIRSRQRVRVHIGAVEMLARIQILNSSQEISPGKKDFAQIRLEQPVVAIPFETFILRQYSPLITIAGGRVIDASATKRSGKHLAETRAYFLNQIDANKRGDKPDVLRLFLERSQFGLLTFSELQTRTGWKDEIITGALKTAIAKTAIIETNGFLVGRTTFDQLRNSIFETIESFHRKEPLAPGILRETLREQTAAHIPVEVFRELLIQLERDQMAVSEDDIVRAKSHKHELSPDEETVKENLLLLYKNANLQVPKLTDALAQASANTTVSTDNARKVFQLLLNSGDLVKVSENFFFAKTAIKGLTKKLMVYADEENENRLIGVPEFKKLGEVSRKYAIPLLEYFDAENITRRAGDKRIIVRSK